MAEYAARDRAEKAGLKALSFSSAGVAAEEGRGSPSDTLRALSLRGLDASGHRGRQLTAEMVDASDLILCAEERHQMWIASRFPRSVGRVRTLKGFAGLPGHPDVADPYDMGPDGHVVCLDEIDRALDNIFKILKEEKR
jgi:protein-tyrosine phosphatase